MANGADVKDAGRGSEGARRGLTAQPEPHLVAEDIFRRISGLGGLLVVALVAPVPARNGVGLRAQLLTAAADKARARTQAEQKQLAAPKRNRKKKGVKS